MVKKEDISLLIGLTLVVLSILLSVIFKFHYWYSFYVLGAFIFFGSMNYRMGSKSVYSYILSKKWMRFIIIYSTGVIFGLLVDIVYGRNVANLWYYPHLGGIGNFLVPILLYYPFGGLQVYEIFYFCKGFLSRFIKSGSYYNLPYMIKEAIMNLLIIILILGFFIPIINLLINSNEHANEIMIVIMILITFSFDALVYKKNKESIFIEFIQGNKLIIFTLVLSWIIAVILSEVPNVFSWEWVYHNVPFTNYEIFKINIIVFTFGWFFLVYASTRLIDLVKLLFHLKEARMR